MSFIKVLGTIAGLIAILILTQGLAYLGTEIPKWKPQILNYLAFYTIGVQWISYLHAGGLFGNQPTEKYYDLIGSLTYLSTICVSLFTISPISQISARQIIVSVCAAIWAIRLGSFLFYRIHTSGGVDSRFAEIKRDWGRFLIAWTIQGAWVFITLLSVLVVNQKVNQVPLKIINYVGIGVWVAGFIIEVTADFQKLLFKKDPANAGRWIDTGLWSVSRHPNYFGEIVIWIGVSLMCIDDFNDVRRLITLCISPVFVALLLIFISGIPLLEQKADDRWGESELYQKYKKNTPVLVPFLKKCW
uniref:CSON004346 protein n=1 Tax=Culicoides sonorensis TaxID=179676 RepID=A0A336LTJ1_CULSO